MTETTSISRGKKFARRFFRSLLLFVLIVVAALIYILSNPGTTRLVRFAIANYLPIQDARLEFSSVRGNPFSRLTFSDVNLIDANEKVLLSADSLRISYKVRSFPSDVIELGKIRIVKPVIDIRQDSLNRWDLVQLFAKDTTSTEPPTIHIEALQIVDGSVRAIMYRPGHDSLLTVNDLQTDLEALTFGESLAMVANHISAEVLAPMVESPASILARAKLDGYSAHVDTLSIVSNRTRLAASGDIDFEDGLFQSQGTDFHLVGEPVHFADISPFVPSLDPSVSGNVRIDVTTTGKDVVTLLNASLSDGSSVIARATRGTLPDSTYRYIFSGTLNNLVTQTFFSSPFTSPVTSRFEGDLTGASLSEVSGSSSITIDRPLRISDATIYSSNGDAVFTQGSANVNVSMESSFGSGKISGTTRPFDEIPTYDLNTTLERISLAPFLAAIDTQSLTGTVGIKGSGINLETLDAELSAEVKGTSVNRLIVNSGTFSANVRDRSIRATGNVKTDSGYVDVRGDLTLSDNLEIVVENLSLEKFDASAASGDTTSSSISGSMSGTAARVSEKWNASATGTLSQVHFATYSFSDARLDVTLNDKLVDVAGSTIVDSANIDVAATVVMTPTGVSVRRAELDFRNFNADDLVPSFELATNLNGKIEVEPIGSSNRLSWTARLDSSIVNRATVESLSADGIYSPDTLTFDVSMLSSAGQLTAAGSTKLGEDLAIYVRESDFSNIDLALFLARDNMSSDLSGTASATITREGDDFDKVIVDASLTPSVWNELQVRSGELSTDIARKAGPISFRAEFTDGFVDVGGVVDLSGEQPAYDVSGRMQSIPIGQMMLSDSLSSNVSAAFSLNGSGSSLETLEADFTITADTSHYGRTRISLLNASGSVHDGAIATENFELESNTLDLSASGTIGIWTDAVPSDFEIVGTLKDARPLNDLLKEDFEAIGKGIFYMTVAGNRGDEIVQLDTDLESVVYGDFRAGRLTAQVLAHVDDSVSFDEFEGNLVVEHFSIPSLTVRRTDFTTELQGDSLFFDVISTIDSRRSLSILGSTDINDDERILTIDDIELVFDDEVWELLQPTTIAYQDYYEVRNLLIYTDSQQIALDGILDLDGEQSLLLTVEEFRMGAVADLFGLTGLGGTVNGYLDLTGPADAPVIQGDLITTVESFGKSYGEMNLVVSYDSLKLNLDGVLRNEDGSNVTINGYIPVNLRLAPSAGQTETGVRVRAGQADLSTGVNLAVVSDNFSLDWILPFLDPTVYSDIGGKVTGEVNITGTVSDPALDGAATLSGGRIGLAYFGLVYDQIKGELEFNDSVIDLQHVQVHSGNGELIALGTVNLSQLNLGEFDVSLSAEDFLAVDNAQYKGSVVADLLLTGTTTEPYISGSAKVVEGEMFLSDEIEEFDPVQLSEEDLLEVERVFGIRISAADTSTFDFYTALALDINLELERNMWLRSNSSPALDIQFTGDLDMQKAKGADLQIFGNIEVIPERSRITQLGKRFRIENGSLTFNGPATDPVLDVEAHYTVPNDDVTIILQVKGHLDDLEEAPLSSDPPMELTDILSYLAFGRSARESLQFSGSGGETLARDIALGQATGYLEGLAGAELGFDVFEIEQRGTETRLTAGKYLTQRLFVSVSQPISFNESTELSDATIREITAEFELIQHLLLKLTQRESLSVDLSWEYSY